MPMAPYGNKVYLAGPMTGLPEFNYPSFHAESARLRTLGFEVISPAEINPDGGTWEACMRRDIGQMVTCHTVALLPGWGKSRGANVEVGLAMHLKIRVVYATDIVHVQEKV